MLYVYLSHSSRQVILPTAVAVGDAPESDPVVTFVDASGEPVALFLRADVAVYSTRNLGPSLPARLPGTTSTRPWSTALRPGRKDWLLSPRPSPPLAGAPPHRHPNP